METFDVFQGTFRNLERFQAYGKWAQSPQVAAPAKETEDDEDDEADEEGDEEADDEDFDDFEG